MGLKKCNCEPDEAVVVENAPLGIQAARAAGCFTIAVNTGPLADQVLAAAGASLILPSIAELSRRWKTIFPPPDPVED
jgi:beta-phosphoglucomutase-like phosphatase (HAD superfamily)